MNAKMISLFSVFLFGLMLSTDVHALGSAGAGRENGVVRLEDAAWMLHSQPGLSQWRYNVSLLALNNENGPEEPGAHSRGWNWHKILGLGTIISAFATVVTGFTGPEGPHCGLAVLSTVMGGATCVNGFWTYGNIFSAGDTRFGIHAASGILSTIGFGAATALADNAPHGEIGAASGVLFMVTVGVVYF